VPVTPAGKRGFGEAGQSLEGDVRCRGVCEPFPEEAEGLEWCGGTMPDVACGYAVLSFQCERASL